MSLRHASLLGYNRHPRNGAFILGADTFVGEKTPKQAHAIRTQPNKCIATDYK